jgi:hypothetical protein
MPSSGHSGPYLFCQYTMSGTPTAVGVRVAARKEAGADLVVGYPARGVEEFLA